MGDKHQLKTCVIFILELILFLIVFYALYLFGAWIFHVTGVVTPVP